MIQYVMIAVVMFGLVYVLNYFTGYTGDDYMYHYFFVSKRPTEATRALNGIGDLPMSLWNHYCNWNGRIVTHAFVQFFMMFDKTLFNICNTIVYLIAGVLLMAHMRTDRAKWTPRLLMVIYVAMFFFFPHFGLSVLWLSGACNYLWMSALLLWFLLFYRNYSGENQITGPRNFGKTVFLFLLGILSGCSNENSGGAVILLAVFFLCYWKWEKWKLPVWGISGILGGCCGLLILLLAPSSASRIGSGLFESGVLLKRLREFLGFSFRYLFILCIILAFVAFKYWKENKEHIEVVIDSLLLPCLYCLAGAASVVVLIASPVISGKSWIWAVCFMIISIGIIWDKIHDCKWKKGSCITVIMVLFVALTGVRYIGAVNDIHRTWKEQCAQITEITDEKEKGNHKVTVLLLTPTDNLYNAISRTPNVSERADAWFNQWMELYYGVEEISGR